jgi:putative transcriptional regulator
MAKTLSKAARDALAATHWRKIDAMTDEDLARQIAANPDAAPDMAPEIDVRAIRRAAGMTQAEFSATYEFSIRTVQEWERGAKKAERARADVVASDQGRPGGPAKSPCRGVGRWVARRLRRHFPFVFGLDLSPGLWWSVRDGMQYLVTKPVGFNQFVPFIFSSDKSNIVCQNGTCRRILCR